MKRILIYAIIALSITILSGCGGDEGNPISPIQKIKSYAKTDGNTAKPTLSDYKALGINSVTKDNISKVNSAVVHLKAKDVDTKEEIQAMVNDINKNEVPQKDTIPPTFTSSQTVTVPENQTDAITLQATDISTPITYSISGGDSASFNVDSSTGKITFKTAPNFETKNTYSFTAKATDAKGNTAIQSVTINISDVKEIVNLQKTFTYDSVGRLVKEDLGNGQYIEYVYDDSGNLISQTVVK